MEPREHQWDDHHSAPRRPNTALLRGRPNGVTCQAPHQRKRENGSTPFDCRGSRCGSDVTGPWAESSAAARSNSASARRKQQACSPAGSPAGAPAPPDGEVVGQPRWEHTQGCGHHRRLLRDLLLGRGVGVGLGLGERAVDHHRPARCSRKAAACARDHCSKLRGWRPVSCSTVGSTRDSSRSPSTKNLKKAAT